MERCVSILLCLLLLGYETYSEPCKPLGDTEKLQMESFVHSCYKLPASQTVTLTDSSTVDAACYRKLIFRSSVPAPLLTLYLAPDGKHLVPAVMDLAVDPAVAQRKMRQELADKLASGAWLTTGDEKAPIKMVVFSDFQCPYCKQFAGIINKLSPEERGPLQMIYRQLPLSIHPWARDAAALSTCVALQDKNAFWQLHDFLFAHQDELSKDTLQIKAMEFLSQQPSVDTKAVSACMDQKSFENRLHQDEQLAIDLGITSTPSAFVNGRKVNIRSVADLRSAIQVARMEVAEAAPVPTAKSRTKSTQCLGEVGTSTQAGAVRRQM